MSFKTPVITKVSPLAIEDGITARLKTDELTGLSNIEIIEEFKDFEITKNDPEAVIMGDIYKNFNSLSLIFIFILSFLHLSYTSLLILTRHISLLDDLIVPTVLLSKTIFSPLVTSLPIISAVTNFRLAVPLYFCLAVFSCPI